MKEERKNQHPSGAERREESSITEEPRSGGQVRFAKLGDEEMRDECASLVSFTSSMYSDPMGPHTALLLSRITAPLRDSRLTQNETADENNNLKIEESRESPPFVNNKSIEREAETETDLSEGEGEEQEKDDFYDELSCMPRSM